MIHILKGSSLYETYSVFDPPTHEIYYFLTKLSIFDILMIFDKMMKNDRVIVIQNHSWCTLKHLMYINVLLFTKDIHIMYK